MSSQSLIITTGDPAGCGPCITLAALETLLKQKLLKNTEPIVIGDVKIFNRLPAFRKLAPQISFINLGTPGIDKVMPGLPSKLTGKASLGYLNRALTMAKREKIPIVTAPVSKEAIAANLPGFCGHTEYLAGHFKIKDFEMMMVSKNLRVILMTRHVPLVEVPGLLKKEKIAKTIILTRKTLAGLFKIKNPRIVLASFNPHAGIDTFLGKEEKELAAAASLFKNGVSGPYPSDTLFTEEALSRYDCVICSYHDQGMIPLKLLAFTTAVNLTIGLPIIRTSPDHGTAFDLIRQGKRPFATSMEEAIKLAINLKL